MMTTKVGMGKSKSEALKLSFSCGRIVPRVLLVWPKTAEQDRDHRPRVHGPVRPLLAFLVRCSRRKGESATPTCEREDKKLMRQ